MGDWIGPVKSPSRHVGFAAEVKLRSERMSVIPDLCTDFGARLKM